MTEGGPVLRIFEVRTKPGCADALLENFATTSAKVVAWPKSMGCCLDLFAMTLATTLPSLKNGQKEYRCFGPPGMNSCTMTSEGLMNSHTLAYVRRSSSLFLIKKAFFRTFS